MTKCYFCGKELPKNSKYCSNCDHETLSDDIFRKKVEYRKQTIAWYALPVLIGIVGGVIAFLIIKDKDPLKARYCIIIGIVTTIIGIVLTWLIENNPSLFQF